MALDVDTLRSSFALVAEREPQVTKRFYGIFCERYPQVKPMFSRNAPEKQQEMLQQALVAVVEHLEDASWLDRELKAMGRKHVDYGVTSEMYDWVGECLLATLEDIAGEAWNDKLLGAWSDAYGAISGLMKAGAAEV